MKKEKGITLIALIITIIVMLLLVGVTVNVALNGGLFNTAKKATIETEMEVIRERAETVKATLYADSVKDPNIKFDIKTYKLKLQEEFKYSELGLTKVIVENRRYDILILDDDLNIEVRIHSEEDSFLKNTDIASETDVYNKYIEWDDSILAGVEVGSKQEILEGFLTFYINYANVKMNNGTVVHDNLEEWIQDEENKEIVKVLMEDIFYGIDMNGVTTKTELYQKIIELANAESEINITTEKQVAELFYNEFFGEKTEKEICSNSWIVYIYKDGTIIDIKANIDLIDIHDSKEYSFKEKGNYEIVIKSITGQELAREKLDGKDIIDNNYEFFLEAGDKNWETDGKGTITKCKLSKSTKEIAIPYKIGNEKIIGIGNGSESISCQSEKIIIPSGVKNINNRAFYNSNALQFVSLPDSLTLIGDEAFYDCPNLEKVNLPSTLKVIGKLAFAGENDLLPLVKIIIPENVESIGEGAFIRSVAEIEVDENNKNYSSEDGILFNKDKTKLIHYPELREASSYTVPSSVKTIGYAAFHLSDVNEIILQEGLERIEEFAFFDSALTSYDTNSITIPNSVVYIGNQALDAPHGSIGNIYFAPGNNPIPEGAPWGADGANIEKLTN